MPWLKLGLMGGPRPASQVLAHATTPANALSCRVSKYESRWCTGGERVDCNDHDCNQPPGIQASNVQKNVGEFTFFSARKSPTSAQNSFRTTTMAALGTIRTCKRTSVRGSVGGPVALPVMPLVAWVSICRISFDAQNGKDYVQPPLPIAPHVAGHTAESKNQTVALALQIACHVQDPVKALLAAVTIPVPGGPLHHVTIDRSAHAFSPASTARRSLPRPSSAAGKRGKTHAVAAAANEPTPLSLASTPR